MIDFGQPHATMTAARHHLRGSSMAAAVASAASGKETRAAQEIADMALLDRKSSKKPARCKTNSILEAHTAKRSPLGAGRALALALLLLPALIELLSSDSPGSGRLVEAQASLLNSLYLPSSSLAQPDAIISKRDLASKQERRSQNVCQVIDGESVAIVEIEESRGTDMTQPTNPQELPISGLANEIELKIESETHKYFTIQNKRLKLTRPLDRDAILKENSTREFSQQPITSIYLQISCQERRQQPAAAEGPIQLQARKVIIPVLVKVLDLNDNAPKFSQLIYTVRVDELTPVNSILLDSLHAVDLDAAANGQIEYALVGPEAPRGHFHQKPTSSLPRLIQRAQPEPAVTTTTLVASPTTLPTTTITTTTSTSTTTPAASFPTRPEVSSSDAPASEPPLITTNAPQTTTRVIVRSRSSNSPTINLDSEPIVNGPMEEGEDEEESDEAMLASMAAGNSSNPSSMDDADSGLDGMVLMLQSPGSVLSRRRKRSNMPMTTAWSGPSTRLYPTTMQQNSPRWTDLMSSDEPLASGRDEQLARQQPDSDSGEFFALELAPNSNKPIIRLKKALDYETRRVHVLHVQATDRAPSQADRRSSIAKVIIKVLDGDDQPPAFVLDQTGCATGSIPAQTTPSPLTAEHSSRGSFARREGELEPQGVDRLPKGFKVTEENFDFGDMSASDELTPPEIEQPTGRGKRYPEPTGSTQIARFPTTKPVYLHDYSCLSGSNLVNTNGNNIAEYLASVMSGESDYLLRVVPQQIKARDRDELNAPIRYSFLNGTPANFTSYFQVNPLDASIKQVAPVDRTQIERFVMFVQAQEQTSNKHASVARLTIDVLASDKNPPLLVPNSYAGFVDENSPLGTNVFVSPSNRSSLMRISVLDDESNTGSNQKQRQIYEFETTSEAFKVNREGFVYVNRWPLDRDAPNQSVHMFQVTARQIGLASSRSISSPVSLNVTLQDLNDNPPVLSNSSLAPIYMPANNRPNSIKPLGSVRATDADSAENSRMRFSVRHVSNNGRDRFRLNADSGELEALGKFVAGEQFSLTVQVADELERWAQGILEVFVVPGPNTGGPQFIVQTSNDQNPLGDDNSRGYTVEINEGIAPHSAVLQVLATDPENDPIAYSIVGGNVNGDFYINSKTGMIQVANKLDREEVRAYQLLVQARDTGGLATNRPVSITITDNNDENPTFERSQYTFSVEEGLSNVILGRVRATDSDLGENGLVSYHLTGSGEAEQQLFAVNATSGELRLLGKLDYERAKQHGLVVTARDHGENPRSTTTSVVVRVVDIQDEPPFFERYHLEVRAPENQANFRLAQVQAKDLDSAPQVSYVMKSGDASLFSVDQTTGVVSTLRGLDFEEAQKHTIFVGTLEMELNETDLVSLSERLISQQLERSPICRIDVTVLDANDNAPRFLHQPLPVRVQDSAQLGSVLTRIQAEDRDGSEPNNQIRYELVTKDNSVEAREASESPASVTNDKCAQSFMVDPASGAISVKADLKRDSQSECQLLVRAHDSQLSSLASLTVYIDHLAEVSSGSSIGFADTSYTIELEENLAANSLVKIVPIINKPKTAFPLSCEITTGNELSKFFVLINEQRDCELRTRDPFLDYETKSKYSLTIKLNTIGGGGGGGAGSGATGKTVTLVNINVLDRNDNRPVFQPVARYSHLTHGKFLAAIADDAPGESQLIQLKATDMDSPQANGLISYELLNDAGELESRFKINSIDGIVRTSKPMEDVPSTRLPLRLRVLARDNPEQAGASLESVAELLVNLIDDRHRMALVVMDSPTGRVLESKEELLGAIQERTGMIAGLEKAESLKVFRNNSLEPDVTGTDFWFYLIEPGTFRIVQSDDARIKSSVLEYRGQNSLLDVVNQSLNLNAIKVRLPYSVAAGKTGSILGSTFSRSFGANGQTFASLLILIALFIALTTTIVVIYQCGFWSSYSRAAAEAAARNQAFQMANEKLYHPSNAYFNQCPPPSNILQPGTNGLNTCSRGSFGGQDYTFRSGFSNFEQEQSLMPQLIGQNSRKGDLMVPYGSNQPPLTNLAAPASKEYETQMLKMSVLFDDSNSVDSQNLNSNIISHNLQS